ncbi:hypothetical protein [Gordonia sp. ABSL49_1]|uniref:hypothetical protein n=1 Tax=Gordonia sp. ABSL49_1 TaxID=2920941 RepID=UPI001F0D03E0|nr:hypothetical protein [Gordonia sp. ABSL49_1]MCH5645130.1 hypothetical protein [Gordonia sp. ABSL49_1]
MSAREELQQWVDRHAPHEIEGMEMSATMPVPLARRVLAEVDRLTGIADQIAGARDELVRLKSERDARLQGLVASLPPASVTIESVVDSLTRIIGDGNV